MSKPIQKSKASDSGFRRRASDGRYTSFVIYNTITKKNERIQIDPPVSDLEAALKLKRKYEIKIGLDQIRARKRFEFLQKYSDQEKLFNSYCENRQKTAKRSWTEDVSRLKQHVFPFFIGELNLNHPSFWYEYWDEFHKYLRTPVRKNTKVLFCN